GATPHARTQNPSNSTRLQKPARIPYLDPVEPRTRCRNYQQYKAPDDTNQDAQKPKQNYKVRQERPLFALQAANDFIIAHSWINCPSPEPRGLHYAGKEGPDAH